MQVDPGFESLPLRFDCSLSRYRHAIAALIFYRLKEWRFRHDVSDGGEAE